MTSMAFNPNGMDPNFVDPMTQPQPQQQASPIESLYSQYLGRGSDQGGLDYWTNQLNSGTSLADIQNAFRNSAEGQAYASSIPPDPGHTTPYPNPITPEPVYGSTNPYAYLTPELPKNYLQKEPSSIEGMYQTYLGRAPDQSGYDYWKNSLESGTDINDIRNAFMNSPEAQDYRNYEPPRKFQPDIPYLDHTTGHTPQNIPQPVYPTGREGIDFDYGMGVNPQVSPLEVDPMGEEAYWKAAENQRKGDIPQVQYDPTFMDDFSNPSKGTGTIQDIFKAFGINQGILPQTQTDPVYDFVKNIDQQLPYLQRAFQEQLQRFGDPVQAALVVLGSLK